MVSGGRNRAMGVWVEESDAPARPDRSSGWRRFWRALGRFIFDYNRY
jgi:hypothetical protein